MKLEIKPPEKKGKGRKLHVKKKGVEIRQQPKKDGESSVQTAEKKDEIPERSNRWIIVAIGTVASMIAILTFIIDKTNWLDKYWPPEKSAKSDSSGSTNISVINQNTNNYYYDSTKKALKNSDNNRFNLPPGNHSNKPSIPTKTMDKSSIAISIIDTNNTCDQVLSGKIVEFINKKNNNTNAKVIPTALQDKNIANVVTGKLTINPPQDIPGANGTHTLKYVVQLILEFRNLLDNTPCGNLALESGPITVKKGLQGAFDIKQRGLDDIFRQLEGKSSLPLCKLK